MTLCFGWIDGHVRRRDERTFQRRFTPRCRPTVPPDGAARRPDTRARRIGQYVAMLAASETIYPQKRTRAD